MNNHPNPNRWWKHRRAGYYTGVVWAILQTFIWIALWFKTGELEGLGPVVAWSYGISLTLIVSYFGNTAVEEYVRKL